MFCWVMAARLPQVMVIMATSAKTRVYTSLRSEKATKKIRRKMAKAAALTATDMKAVMDVGAPS